MQKSFVAATLAALAVASAASGAVVLANWTFEVSIPVTAGPLTAELGLNAASSFATGSHVSGATAYSNPAGNGSVESFSSNNWAIGDYYQFTTSTASYNNISFQWDQTSSNTGPRDFQVFASTDGVNFSALGAMFAVLANATPNPVWNATTSSPIYTNSRSGNPLLDNQANVTFRVVMMTNVSANGTGTVAAAGSSRVDNVIISGDLVPTPGSASLIGLGALAAMRRRR